MDVVYKTKTLDKRSMINVISVTSTVIVDEWWRLLFFREKGEKKRKCEGTASLNNIVKNSLLLDLVIRCNKGRTGCNLFEGKLFSSTGCLLWKKDYNLPKLRERAPQINLIVYIYVGTGFI